MRARAVWAAAALLAVSAPAFADEGLCDSNLRIRNRLDKPGFVLKPASVALQHSAGEDTVGLAQVAAMYARECGSGNAQSQFELGGEYHLNTSDDAPVELANGGATYSYGWSNAEMPLAGTWKEFTAVAKYGRNIEKDTTMRYVGVDFAATALSGMGPDGYRHGVGWLGGEGLKEDNTPLYAYGVRPGLEYYSGYQPEEAESTLDGVFATVSVAADWYPFPKIGTGNIRLFADWTTRQRQSGDDALPESANLGGAGIAYQFLDTKTADGKSKQVAAVSLEYRVGRDPDSGFLRDESFELVLTYTFDRQR